MEDAGLETGGGEGALHDTVIATRAFDGDQTVAQLVLREGVTDLSDGGVQSGSRMGNHGRGKDNATVEVGEEKLGASLGTVEAEDAKVFRTDLLDAGVEHAARLTHRRGNAAAR